MQRLLLVALILFFSGTSVLAGEVSVAKVVVEREASGNYRFNVTLEHADEGWKHYADRWEVLTLEGTILATRTLYHPHVEEQPFTRSLSGVQIPGEVTRVQVRGHDSVHGYGAPSQVIALPSK